MPSRPLQAMKKEKRPKFLTWDASFDHMLDSAGNFTGTQTPGTNVHMARGTIDNRLYALDIGLPRAVGTPVRVRDLDTKGNTLVTELTLSHPLHLLAVLDE